MKKLSKKDKVTVLIIAIFMVVVISIYVALIIVFHYNTNHLILPYININTSSESQIQVNVYSHEDMSKSIIEKPFSQSCLSANLSTIVFSPKNKKKIYEFKVEIINSNTKEVDYTIALGKKGSDKECSSCEHIECELIVESNKFGKKYVERLSKNQRRDVYIRVASKLETTDLPPCPAIEFEIQINAV